MRNRTTAVLLISSILCAVLIVWIAQLPGNPISKVPPALLARVPTIARSRAIDLDHDEMLILQSPKGTAILQLLDLAPDNAIYRWRLRQPGQPQEQTGIAAIHEPIDPAAAGAGPRDEDAAIIVIADAFALRCVYSEQRSTWTVYYDPASTLAFVGDDTQFEAISLGAAGQ